MTTTWHRMTRADFYATGTLSHGADECASPDDCPAEVVAPENSRFDMRESWTRGEQERLTWTIDDRMGRLADMQRQVEQLQFGIRSEVSDARLANVPWSKIGEALGMSKQGAQQQYSR